METQLTIFVNRQADDVQVTLIARDHDSFCTSNPFRIADALEEQGITVNRANRVPKACNLFLSKMDCRNLTDADIRTLVKEAYNAANSCNRDTAEA